MRFMIGGSASSKNQNTVARRSNPVGFSVRGRAAPSPTTKSHPYLLDFRLCRLPSIGKSYSGAMDMFRAQLAFRFGPKRSTAYPTEAQIDLAASNQSQISPMKFQSQRFHRNQLFSSESSPITDGSIRYLKNCQRSVKNNPENQRNKKNQLCPAESDGPENEGASEENQRSVVFKNEDV
jgi:hypothetical protein